MQNEISFSKITLEIPTYDCLLLLARSTIVNWLKRGKMCSNYVCWPGHDRSEGKKVWFLKSEKIGKKNAKKCCGLCCRAAIISWFFFKAQNPRLINESGFKSRAAYDGPRTVVSEEIIWRNRVTKNWEHMSDSFWIRVYLRSCLDLLNHWWQSSIHN